MLQDSKKQKAGQKLYARNTIVISPSAASVRTEDQGKLCSGGEEVDLEGCPPRILTDNIQIDHDKHVRTSTTSARGSETMLTLRKNPRVISSKKIQRVPFQGLLWKTEHSKAAAAKKATKFEVNIAEELRHGFERQDDADKVFVLCPTFDRIVTLC